jgi:hypothetical protein
MYKEIMILTKEKDDLEVEILNTIRKINKMEVELQGVMRG